MKQDKHTTANLIAEHNAQGGISTRHDCPLCGRYKAVSVRREAGKVSIRCFGVDCELYYRKYEAPSIDELRKKEITYTRKDMSSCTPVLTEEYATELGIYNYITDNNCIEALARGMIMYDNQRKRVVLTNGLRSVGRSIIGQNPKWLCYDNFPHPFYVKHKDFTRGGSIVIVEDAPSACSLMRCTDAMALLSTTLKTEWYSYLKPYDTIYVALDPDALDKAIKIHKELSWYYGEKNIVLLQIEREFKKLSIPEIKEILDVS